MVPEHDSRTILLVGAAGHMGRAVAERLWAEEWRILPCEHEQHPARGEDYGIVCGRGARGVPLMTLAEAAAYPCDAVVDFSNRAGFSAALSAAGARRVPFLSGTTGLSADEERLLDEVAHTIPLLHSANMSYGVAVLAAILPHLARLTRDMAVEIVEVHHDRKKDAPSGTALRLGTLITEARGTTLDTAAVYGRHGTDLSRPSDEIGFHAVRGGDVVGDHTILFFGDGERIELTHRAHHRTLFAAGAVRALKWLFMQQPGRYTMQDVVAGAST